MKWKNEVKECKGDVEVFLGTVSHVTLDDIYRVFFGIKKSYDNQLHLCFSAKTKGREYELYRGEYTAENVIKTFKTRREVYEYLMRTYSKPENQTQRSQAYQFSTTEDDGYRD